MSYYGRVAEAKADSKAVCKYDNAMDSTSPVEGGGSDGGGMGPKEEFASKTYVIKPSQTSMRRSYK